MSSTDYSKMPPPYIIEHLKKEEERKRKRSPAQIPIYNEYPEYPPEDRPSEEKKPDRGVLEWQMK